MKLAHRTLWCRTKSRPVTGVKAIGKASRSRNCSTDSCCVASASRSAFVRTTSTFARYSANVG